MPGSYRIVREAVDRSLIRFEAREPPAGEVPVILPAGASGILLHEAIGHALEADFNHDGTSVYAGQVGENVAGCRCRFGYLAGWPIYGRRVAIACPDCERTPE